MAVTVSLPNVRACVFDAYGTLFDFAAAAERCCGLLGDKTEALTNLWRTKQLQYTWLRSLMGRFEDFWHVTGASLDYAMATLGLKDPLLRARLMELYLRLDPFPEVKEVLGRLKSGGLRTAILSNGSLSMLTAAVNGAGMARLLDDVISVDELKIYKPHPSVYQLAADRVNEPPENIAFMSSNGWDANGAANFGFRVVWVNRYGQPPENIPEPATVEVRTLGDLPSLLGV